MTPRDQVAHSVGGMDLHWIATAPAHYVAEVERKVRTRAELAKGRPMEKVLRD